MIIILYKCKTRGISFGPEMTSTNDVTIPSLVKVTPTPSPPQTSPTEIAAPECFGDFKMVIDQTLLQGTFRYLSLLWVKPCQIQLTPIIAMLWFNFILGLILFRISHCFKLIIVYYHTSKQREVKFQPRIKLNHNTYNISTVSQCRRWLQEASTVGWERKFPWQHLQ